MVSALFLTKVFVAFAPLVSVYAHPQAKFPALLDATADDLVTGLHAGDFTSVDLVKAYIGRIMEVNKTLHMVAEINPDALSIAKKLDQERASGKIRGPLHGLPVLLKNNIATADKMNNTAGSWSLIGAKVPRDATVAAKLREAGAILLGKSNLSQWANFRSDNSSDGWSAQGGQTYGAYYRGQNPSGSSSGSGVSASLGLAWGTLGTETDGSIISPSEVNNIVGIKPTVGLTSRALVIPISEHQDTVGAMARTVKDAAHILHAISGPDNYDNYTSAIPWAKSGKKPDYVAACKLDALKGKRIGVPRNYIGTPGESTVAIYDAFEAALDTLRSAGAIIVENTNYTAYDEWSQSAAEGIVLDGDFSPNLAHYLSQLTHNPNNIHTLEDLRRFTQSFPAEDYPDRDTAEFDRSIAQTKNYTNTDAAFWAAYQKNQYLGGEGGILGALKKYNLDAVVGPSVVAYPISAIVGAPVVTVPLGKMPEGTKVLKNERGDLKISAPNQPFGICFSGARWSEEALIGFAYAFEQKTKVRESVKPYLLPKVELADVVGK